MAKTIKGFITRDDIILPNQSDVAPVFEISDISLTYSRNKQQYYSTNNTSYSLYVFSKEDLDHLSQTEANNIIRVVDELTYFLSQFVVLYDNQAKIDFTNYFNNKYPNTPIVDLDFFNVVSYNTLKTVNYLTFKITGIRCLIWLSDLLFRNIYPDYDISVVLPFSNFASIVNNPASFINALNNFDLVEFNRRIEHDKNNNPTTYTKILNIPYRVPNTNIDKNCYFGFNIYGIRGNFDFILKLELYNYLTTVLGLDGNLIESLFPSILYINEFFITPRWDKIAIPSQIGLNAINSQVTLSYTEPFDTYKFIAIYNDQNYIKENTYNVPFDYNNILLQVTNGRKTDEHIRDFKEYFKDFITVTSTHPDFARMSQRTQRFVSLLESMLEAGDSNSLTEMINKIVANTNYELYIINRGNTEYLTVLFDEHQIFLLPKYEFFRLA